MFNRREFIRGMFAGAGLLAVPGFVVKTLESMPPAPLPAPVQLRTFQDMLNEYLPTELIKAEMEKRDFLLSHVVKDDSWSGMRMPLFIPRGIRV